MSATANITGGESLFVMTCFHQTEEQKDGSVGFIPCMVIAGESGFFPMSGGEEKDAWIWGKTHEDCMKACKDYNTKTLGLSEAEVRDVLISAAIASAAQ